MFPSGIKFDPQFKLPNGDPKLTLLLQLNEADLEIPPEVRDRANIINLRQKPEFHLTVIGFAGAKKLNQAVQVGQLQPEAIAEIIAAYNNQLEIWQTLDYFVIDKTYENSDSEAIPPGGQYRKTIVNLVHAPAVEAMVIEINNLIENKKFKLPDPFLHVTLFSYGENLKPNLVLDPSQYIDPFIGIGLNSKEDFTACNPQQIKILHPEDY